MVTRATYKHKNYLLNGQRSERNNILRVRGERNELYSLDTIRNCLQTIDYFKRKRLDFRQHYLKNYVTLEKTV